MGFDTAAPRTRRAVLAAAAGAAAAAVAATLGNVAPVQAANGDPVVAGAGNESTVPTTVTMTPVQDSAGGAAVSGVTSYPGAYGLGFGIGVSGLNNTTSASPDAAWGVYGESPHGIGVRGRGATGVMGVTGSNGGISDAWSPIQRPGTGVAGYAQSGTSESTGVYGHAYLGAGVRGVGNTGVEGDARTPVGIGNGDTAIGVAGLATRGTGVYGEATTGYALRTKGRIKLDGCSGLATIQAGQRSVTVTPGVALFVNSAIVATLQAAAGGTTTVHRCHVNADLKTFTIYLTAASIVKVRVAWLVIG
jgi:hypothetical protein